MTNGYVFREYIGAQFTGVKFSDVPVNSGVSFHFILAFAIDYMATQSSSKQATPTNGVFTPYWDEATLSQSAMAATKTAHPNLSIMVGLGGDSVQDTVKVLFTATSVDSWVANAVTSLSAMINKYGLGGVDVDYEHFATDVDVFVECIGRMLTQLKTRFPYIKTSIAPFEDDVVHRYYRPLWRRYSGVIDYVNFQSYGYDRNTDVDTYVRYYDQQVASYPGAKVLASFTTGTDTTLLSPEQGLSAAQELLRQGKLPGLFIWSADSSKRRNNGFAYETRAQQIVANH